MANEFRHWSDIAAENIIRQKGDKDTYVIASGITPSGTVHFGNFREVITVDMVGRALKRKGKNVRFIFSWDDFDTFRKIPANMPKKEMLEKYMFQPIVDTPDPFETDESYARHHQKNLENDLAKVGVDVEYLYQAKKYRAGEYKEGIKKALDEAQTIRDILNVHRTSPLGEDWLPTSIYCGNCNTDHGIKNQVYNAEAGTIAYECESCGHKGEVSLDDPKSTKLKWRIDWPMRWNHEQVDFEPGGKDHSSDGGSFSTGKEIVKQVYGYSAPVYLQYDFVSIRGAGGKMSSSSGNVVTLGEVLKIYEPEIVRWIFAHNKTNLDFAISFDSEVFRTYEEFDKVERLALGAQEGNEKKTSHAKRIYEASVLDTVPSEYTWRPSFRHLTSLLQIYKFDTEKVVNYYEEADTDAAKDNVRRRCERATYWLENYADEEFKFSINNEPNTSYDVGELKAFLTELTNTLESEWSNFQTDKDLHEKMYEVIKSNEIQPSDAFKLLYNLLISKDKGPKLASFLRIIGKDEVLKLLKV